MGNTYTIEVEDEIKDVFVAQTNIELKNTNIIDKLYHQSNESVVVNEQLFLDRYGQKTKLNNGDNLLDDFDWSNIVLAGGFILGCLEKEELQHHFEKSDLDFWVYGETLSILKEKMKKVIMFFHNKLPDLTFEIYNNSFVVTLKSTLFKSPVQIIGVIGSNSIDVIKFFDFTHCQIGYDGTKLIYNKEFVDAMVTRQTKTNKNVIKMIRLGKALERGFIIDRSDDFNLFTLTENGHDKYHISNIPLRTIYSNMRNDHPYTDHQYTDQPYNDTKKKLKPIIKHYESNEYEKLFEYMDSIVPDFINRV
jgi:hypothetical protein